MVARHTAAWSLILAFFAAPGATANTVALDLSVLSPDGPIRTGDTIDLLANTSFDVFPDTAYAITSEFTVDGWVIDWTLTSRESGGIGFQILTPFGHSNVLGVLPPGEYTVNAAWTHELFPPFFFNDLIDDVTGGVGQLQFTVTPKPGDADGDGVITLLDLDILGENFGRSPADFSQGDFNDDDVVDLLDLDILGAAFGGPEADAVPEPATLYAVAIAGVGAFWRRRP